MQSLDTNDLKQTDQSYHIFGIDSFFVIAKLDREDLESEVE